jgi:intracellular multiplication protein IcmP
MSENAVGWLILLVVFIALGWLFWTFFEYQVKDTLRWVRYGEMKIVTLFTTDDYTLSFTDDSGRTYNFAYDEAVENIPKIRTSCEEYPENQRDILMYCLNDQTMRLISHMAMAPVRYVVVAILLAMGIWAYMYGPKSYYRRKLDMNSLVNHQSRNFPVIAPFNKFNPSDQPPRPPGSPVPAELPLFAEALGPEEWIAYNSIPVPDGKLDERAAQIAFSRQLGPPWRGAARLEPYKQIILASFCLKACRKRSDADDMLGALSQCWTLEKGLVPDKKLVAKARAILRNKDMAASTLSLCNQHAYQTTAMLRALAHAREEGGVLAPAQFVWLRAHNRNTWYPLNNLGRQSFHMEALGAMAHYKLEKLTQRPIPKPKVDAAVESIRAYMNSVKARPIPQLDYAGRKKAIKKPKAGVKKPPSAGPKPKKAGA